MEMITLTISADKDGRYKVVDVLKQIQISCRNIKFPDKPIEDTCLADLMLHGKQCIRGISKGLINTWSMENFEYGMREITLYFA